jgi:cytochrome c
MASKLAQDGIIAAQKGCAFCHAVGAPGESRVHTATPFREFSAKWKGEELARAVAVKVSIPPHPKLPQSVIEPGNLAKIIAYIKSL